MCLWCCRLSARTGLQGANDYNKYLEEELMEWLKHHKEFEDIIK